MSDEQSRVIGRTAKPLTKSLNRYADDPHLGYCRYLDRFGKKEDLEKHRAIAASHHCPICAGLSGGAVDKLHNSIRLDHDDDVPPGPTSLYNELKASGELSGLSSRLSCESAWTKALYDHLAFCVDIDPAHYRFRWQYETPFVNERTVPVAERPVPAADLETFTIRMLKQALMTQQYIMDLAERYELTNEQLNRHKAALVTIQTAVEVLGPEKVSAIVKGSPPGFMDA